MLLLLPQGSIDPILFQELVVCPTLTDLTISKDQDLVGMDDGRETALRGGEEKIA